MSDEAPAATPGPASPANHWKRRGRGPKAVPIARDEAARQGAVTTLAFLVLGRERAIAFLNEEHAELGGQPLALATASTAGLANVEAEIRRIAGIEPDDASPVSAR